MAARKLNATIGASPMADNNFRSDRSRDPLAELARLIGQGGPYAESAPHQYYGSERSCPAADQVDCAAAGRCRPTKTAPPRVAATFPDRRHSSTAFAKRPTHTTTSSSRFPPHTNCK